MADSKNFNEILFFDGEKFPAEIMREEAAIRAGFKAIYAIQGLPPVFERDLIVSSQVSEVPHTWRVHECKDTSQVTEAIVQLGKKALDTDRRERGVHLVTYIGDKEGNQNFIFLAAGAIRNKLTSTFEDEQYPVLSRAIVAPAYRGLGLGSLIVEHRFSIVLNFFQKKPKAIHFGTESEKTLHSVRRIEKILGIKYVHIGNEELELEDGIHTVADYLCFMPWFQKELLSSVDSLLKFSSSPDAAAIFKDKLSRFMTSGVESVTGAELEESHRNLIDSLSPEGKETEAALLLNEVFIIKEKIGAR